MSQNKRNWVLLVLCAFLVFSSIACVIGGGDDFDLVQGMQDTNEALQDTAEAATDAGLIR